MVIIPQKNPSSISPTSKTLGKPPFVAQSNEPRAQNKGITPGVIMVRIIVIINSSSVPAVFGL